MRALLTPTDEPMFAGFTKHGNPSSASTRTTNSSTSWPARQGERARVLETRAGEHPLHRDLVHRDRGSEHTRADVGKARELEQALYGAVFAVGPVQQRDHDVRVTGARRARYRHDLALDRERDRELVTSGSQHPACLTCEQPAPFGRDPDGHDVVLRGIEGAGDGYRGDAGDVVLGGLASEQDHDSATRPGHGSIVAHITWSTARMPSPMMNSPPRPYASSIHPRAFHTYL